MAAVDEVTALPLPSSSSCVLRYFFCEAIQNEFLLVLLQLPTLEQQKVDEQRPPPAGREFYRKFRASVHTTLKDENWILIQDYTHNKRQQTSFPLETV